MSASNKKPKKAFYITAGRCYPNTTDSVLIKSYLKNNGWALSRKIESANVIIINTCAFRKQEEDGSIGLIKKVHREKNSNAQVIVVGCLPAINKIKLKKIFKGIIVKANSLGELNKLLDAKAKIQEIKYIGSARRLKTNKDEEYCLRIGWGCHEKCSYCSVRFVFGKPRSRPVLDILQELDNAYSKGYRKFVLVSNDSGSYGEDLNISLVSLIDKLCKQRNDCQFALSHLNPDKLKKMLPLLAKFIRSRKIWRMNIPVESGSNRILRLMNRRYTVGDFKDYIQKLTQFNHSLEIKTDFLVGFPSETDYDSLDSLKLAEWLGRHRVDFQCLAYSKRPNTKASRMPGQIDNQTKKDRLKQLSSLCKISYTLRDKKLFKKLKRQKL